MWQALGATERVYLSTGGAQEMWQVMWAMVEKTLDWHVAGTRAGSRRRGILFHQYRWVCKWSHLRAALPITLSRRSIHSVQ